MPDRDSARRTPPAAAVDRPSPADPQDAQTCLARGDRFRASGQSTAARGEYQQALAIDPRNAEAHYNLGLLAMNEQRPQEAIKSLGKAIELRFDFCAAHRQLGGVLASLGKWDAAEASLGRALSLEPGSPEILFELATIVARLGKYSNAASLLARALLQAPQPLFKRAFVDAVVQAELTVNDPPLRAVLAAAVTDAWVMPYILCRPAIDLILLDEEIAQCVRGAQAASPERLPKAALFGKNGLGALTADHLLLALLETVPINTMQFERFLTRARQALLETASNDQAPERSNIAALPFYAALARQCFINEYVFADTGWERETVNDCRATLLALLNANTVVPPLLVLAVAAYLPLHSLPDARRLLKQSHAEPVSAVLRQQVLEPLEEAMLCDGIERLTSVAPGVSVAVRNQYEENPYPRWVKMPMRTQTLPLNDELRRTLPFVPFTPMFDDGAPEVLVAGCGTGSDAIFVADRFSGARVLAIDLSLRSLCYAKRKTHELGLSNIRYAQADILALGELALTFDLISAVGVLHHLADPFSGWRILLSRLRPGGFMCIGLYSQLGRRHLIKAHDLIASRGYTSTPDDIRRFRQDVFMQQADAELQLVSSAQSFYSMSDCRDLAFHVQEHNLSLQQIDSFLAEQRLQFLGFELDPHVVHRYRARFAKDRYGVNLTNWARFERDNPDTFSAMYRFWIQKPRIS